MDQTACCTCANLLSQTPQVIASSSSSSSSSSSLCEKERPLPENRQLECCGRVICGGCIHKNPRFDTYCPYCQTSSTPSSSSGSPLPLPSRFSLLASRTRRRGLAEEEEEEPKEPPPYQKTVTNSSSPSPPLPSAPEVEVDDKPPPYTPEAEAKVTNEPDDKKQPPSYDHHNGDSPAYLNEKNTKKSLNDNNQDEDEEDGEPILHFLHHPNDTINSLSLRYNIPPQTLRSFNRLIGSDHLLLGRQTILIPRPHHYHLSSLSHQHHLQTPDSFNDPQGTMMDKQQGKNKQKLTSLSPRPIHGEEEEARRSKIRRWMIACKCPDYDVALIYLSQADYDLDAATENYFADEAWERDHPVPIPSGSGSSSGGNAKTNKIRDYHQRRLSKRIPASLLQPNVKW